MKKVIELIRVSTEGQAATDRASLPSQREANRKVCVQYGLQIIKTIELVDVSGASVLLAPEIQNLMVLMQAPEVHGVVAREFSRLMRPEKFSDYALLQAFLDTNTVLYLPDGPIDLNNKSGFLLGGMRALMAGTERREILERVWTAKESKRNRGEHPQSQICLPYGVGYANGKFFYTQEADRVREAYVRFMSGETSYHQLAQIGGWSLPGIRNILRNPIYTGWRVYDKKRDMSAAGRYTDPLGRQTDRKKMKRTAEEVIRVKVIDEPLISEADWQQVQQVMDAKRAKHWRTQEPDREGLFTYARFLTCSCCDKTIYTRLARRYYYVCKGRIPDHDCQSPYMGRERLESQLDALVSTRLTDAGFLKACFEEWQIRMASGEEKVAAQRLTNEIQQLRGRREKIVEAFIDGVLSRELRDAKLAQTDAMIAATQQRLLRTAPQVEITPKVAAGILRPFMRWDSLPRDKKRMLLASTVPDIRVSNYEVESVGLNLPVVSKEVRMAAASLANEYPYRPLITEGLLYIPMRQLCA